MDSLVSEASTVEHRGAACADYRARVRAGRLDEFGVSECAGLSLGDEMASIKTEYHK
jgi:hypothetical protein